ncbi:MAG: RNA polymerase sigma factor [Azospirillaceae bacterium]
MTCPAPPGSSSESSPGSSPGPRPAPQPAAADPVASLRVRLRECLPVLRRYARNLTGNEADGDDLVQEVCIRALERGRQWNASRPLHPWLLGMMHNLHVDRFRAAARQDRVLRQMTAEGGAGAVPATAEARLNLRRVGEAMESLSEERRALLLLVCVEGLTYREAAEALDLPIGTVMSRLSRARTALLEALDAPGGRLFAETGD